MSDKLAVTAQPRIVADAATLPDTPDVERRRQPALAKPRAVPSEFERTRKLHAPDHPIVLAQAVTPSAPVDEQPATATTQGLDAAQTRRARETTTRLLEASAALDAAGLHVDVRTAADEAPAITTRDVLRRDAAAALYGVTADKLTGDQLADFQQHNPELTAETIPKDTAIAIAGTPASLAMARTHLELTELAVASRPADDPMRQAVAQRLLEVRGAERQFAISASLDEARGVANRLVSEGRYDGVSVPYERVRRDIQRARDGHVTTEPLAELALDNVDAAESQTLAAVASASARAFVDRRRELYDSAMTPTFGDEMGIIASQKLEALREHDATRAATVDRVERSTRAAIARLEDVQGRTPESAAFVAAQIEMIRRSGQQSLAAIDVAVGDHAAAERRLLPTASQPLDAMTDTARDQLARDIAALPSRERHRATAGLVDLAGLYERNDDASRTDAASALLTAVAGRSADASLQAQAAMFEARRLERNEDFAGARTILEGAMQRARAVDDPTRARETQVDVVAGQVALERAAAVSSDSAVARDAADRMRALRQRLEVDGPLSRDQLARLSLIEAQTFLSQSRADAAGESVANLDRYRDLPWATQAAEAFARDHTESGITAAIKVGLHASMSTSPGVAVGVTLGGGVVGAGIGFFFGGPPGAGVGFLAGSGLGGLGVSAYGVARHYDEVRQAFRTGMTSLTATDALTDTAFLGLSVAGALAPLGGATRLAALGLSRGAVTASLRTALTEAGATAAEAEISRRATRILMQQFGEGVLRFGGRPLSAAAVTAMVGPVAAQYARIEAMPAGPEKDAARRRFEDNLTQAGLVTSATLAASALARRMILRGGNRWPEEVARLPDAVPSQTPTLSLDEATAQLEALPRHPMTATGAQLDVRTEQLRAIRRTLEAEPRSPAIEERLDALSTLEGNTVSAIRMRTENDGIYMSALRDDIARIDTKLDSIEQRFASLGAKRGADGTITVDDSHDAQALYDALAGEEIPAALSATRSWANLRRGLGRDVLSGDAARGLDARIAALQPRFDALNDYRTALTAAIERRQSAGQHITGPMRDLHLGEEAEGVWYMTQAERASRAVSIRDGRLYDAHGQVISTERAHSQHGGDAHAIFVLAADGELYYSDAHRQSVFHHSTFVAGAPVQAAGEIVIADGRLVRITDNSGHYQPSRLMTRQFITYLQQHGVDLEGVTYRDTLTGAEGPVLDAFGRGNR